MGRNSLCQLAGQLWRACSRSVVLLEQFLAGQLLPEPQGFLSSDPQLEGHLSEDGAARLLLEAQLAEEALGGDVAKANLCNEPVDILQIQVLVLVSVQHDAAWLGDEAPRAGQQLVASLSAKRMPAVGILMGLTRFAMA